MKTLNDYFDLARSKTSSDRQTAIRMGITPNRISMARKDGYMSNEFCVKLAEVAGVDPMEVIAAAEVKKHPDRIDFWSKWLAASLAGLAVVAGISTIEYSLFSMAYLPFLIGHSIHYAQS